MGAACSQSKQNKRVKVAGLVALGTIPAVDSVTALDGGQTNTTE